MGNAVRPLVQPASWAEGASGSPDIVTPDPSYILAGWPLSATPPSRGRWNWVLNWVTNGVRYLSRRGVSDYAATETYMTGDRVIGDDGLLYRSRIDTNLNHLPSTSATQWEEWGPTILRTGSFQQSQQFVAFTTAGTAPNFTLATAPAFLALQAGLRYRVKFHAASTGADVLALNSLANKALKQYASDGTKVPAVFAVNQLSDVEYDGTDFVLLDRIPAPIRTRLTGNTVLYVNASTGNDSNTGLTSGTPFLTVQAAINKALTTYDLNGFNLTIQLADGTYAVSGVSVGSISAPITGAVSDSSLTIQGNAGTPSNVICQATNGQCFGAIFGAGFCVKDMKLQTVTGGNALLAEFGGRIQFSNIVFGAVPAGNYHLYAIWAGSSVLAQGNYTVAGGGNCHAYASQGATISVNGFTVTVTGTPAFTTSFAYAVYCGVVDFASVTFSGSATGARYQAFVNGVVNSNGGGASYFPGNSAGSTASGGQYA